MTLREKLELAGYRLRALSLHMPSDWQKQMAFSRAQDAIRAASVDRSGEADKTAQTGLAGGESAVPERQTPND